MAEVVVGDHTGSFPARTACARTVRAGIPCERTVGTPEDFIQQTAGAESAVSAAQRSRGEFVVETPVVPERQNIEVFGREDIIDGNPVL